MWQRHARQTLARPERHFLYRSRHLPRSQGGALRRAVERRQPVGADDRGGWQTRGHRAQHRRVGTAAGLGARPKAVDDV